MTDENEGLDEQGPEWDDNFDADRARSLITKLRGEVKASKALELTDEQKQMLTEYNVLREASQTDAERQQAQIESLQQTAGQVPTLTAENLRLQVALDKGLSTVLAKRLQGATRDELEADADTLLGLVTQTQGMRPNPAQGTSGGGPTLADQLAAAEKAGDTKSSIRLKSALLLQQQ